METEPFSAHSSNVDDDDDDDAGGEQVDAQLGEGREGAPPDPRDGSLHGVAQSSKSLRGSPDNKEE